LLSKEFVETIERVTGRSSQDIRNTPICQTRWFKIGRARSAARIEAGVNEALREEERP
jgi:hypothetical protein